MDLLKKTMDSYMSIIKTVYEVPWYECIVSKDNEIIYRYNSDASQNKRVFAYSITKPITCVGVLRLLEEGKISLEDDAARYIPELSKMRTKNGTAVSKITIKDLFTMCAGFNYDLKLPSVLKTISENPDAGLLEIVKAIAKEPLEFEPGEHFRYSLCHDVLAAVAEIVSGMSFGEYQKKNIFEPLCMDNTSYHADDEKDMAKLYNYTFSEGVSDKTGGCEFIFTPNYESGGAGLVTTADDYIKFSSAMANKGMAKNGYKLLKSETVELMKRNMLPAKIVSENIKFAQGYGYGLGVRTLIDKEKCSAYAPLGEFGWSGAAGAYTLMDTDNNISICYIQHMYSSPKVANDLHPMLRDIVYASLGINRRKKDK